MNVHPKLGRFMHVAAMAGIAAFLSFPTGSHALGGADVARWLGELITRAH